MPHGSHGLAHGYGHVDAQVAIVREQLSDGGVKDQAVAVHDGAAHALMDAPRSGFPGQPSPVTIQL